MKITNTRVYGLEESIIASRYPKMAETPDEDEFIYLRGGIDVLIDIDDYGNSEKEKQCVDRAKNLGKAKQGSGHDCFLKGIIVQADFTANQAFWLQHGRYDYSDIVSSQSKMHCLTKMNIDEQCNKWVDKRSIENLQDYIDFYNDFETYYKGHLEIVLRNGEKLPFTKENLFQSIINNCPIGLNLTARITDNYLSLKTQYNQRKHHELEEWQDWKKWVEGLPYFMELIGKGECE